MNFTKYLAHFKSLFGAAAVISGSLPFLAIVPSVAGATSFFFPPLGDQTIKAQILTFSGVLLVIMLVYFLAAGDWLESGKNKARLMLSLFGAALLSMMLYFGLSQIFVLKYEIPSESRTIYLSTGYAYTENVANRKMAFTTAFGPEGISMSNVNDEEKIHSRGFREEDIKWIWTPASLYVVRFSLWLTYLIFVLSLVAAFSFGVYFDLATPRRAVKRNIPKNILNANQ